MGVGNLLLIAAEKLPSAPRPEWIQAHGQVQIFGWVGSFILGISLYVLPKFRRVPLQSIALARRRTTDEGCERRTGCIRVVGPWQ